MEFSGRDSFGRYTLSVEGNIVVAKVSGVVGIRLGQAFNQSLKVISESLEGPWGYFANLLEFGACSQETEIGLFETHRICQQGGCSACAFLIESPVAKHQLSHVRKALCLGFEHQVFADHQQAKQFLTHAIA